jgi:putative PEP-CTERM system TPR-repeat lipoprotein
MLVRRLLPILLAAALLPQPALQARAETDSRQEYQTARIALQNRLQKNPNDREARRQLGLLSLEWGNGQAAEKQLLKAIELGIPRESLQFPLAEALLMQGKYQAVLDQLAPMALMSAQDQALLLAYRGDAWLGLGQPERAKQEYTVALNTRPDTPLAKLGMAKAALFEGRVEDAQARVAEVLAAVPDEPKAWSLQGAVFEAAKQPQQAEASYGKAIALKRFSPVELASRAIIRINAGKLKEAEADYGRLSQEVPDFFLTHYTAGLLNLKQGKYGEAQIAFEKALKTNDRFESLDYYLGVTHVYQRHDQEAEKYLTRFMGHQPQALEPRLFLALVKFRANNLDAARSLLASVLEAQPDNEFALKLMSDIEFADGNHPQGFKYLEKIPQAHKRADRVDSDAGMDVAEGDDREKILAKLEATKKLDAKLAQQLTAVVLRQMADKDFEQAVDLVGKIGKKDPQGPLADNLAGLLGLAQNNQAKAKKAFEAALEKSPGNPVITHELAQMEAAEGKPEAARKLYEKALRSYPKHIPTRIYLANLDLLEGKPKAMEERLAGAIRDYPTALQPRMVLASHFLNDGNPGRAQSVLEGVQQAYPNNAAFMTLLIHCQLENHEPQKALVAAKVFIQNEPGHAMAHYLMARAYAELHDPDSQHKALGEALAIDPNFLPARYTQVKMLAAEKKMPEADDALVALAKQYPDNAEVMALRGWLAAAQGKGAEATAAYRATLDRFPSTKGATDLAQAQWKAGEREAAVKTLEDWVGQHPDSAPARLMLSEFYVAQGKEAEAIQQLEAILKRQPENLLVMNNLAWLYRKPAPDKALEVAQWAAAIAPKSPNVLDTLAMIELDQGKTAKALKLLKQAAEAAPRQQTFRYHLALAMDQAGRGKDAVAVLKELLGDPRPFPDRQQAQALLDKLSAR